jgi:hypothetical protein
MACPVLVAWTLGPHSLGKTQPSLEPMPVRAGADPDAPPEEATERACILAAHLMRELLNAQRSGQAAMEKDSRASGMLPSARFEGGHSMTVFRSPLGPLAARDISITERVFEGVATRQGEPVLIEGPTGRTMIGHELWQR